MTSNNLIIRGNLNFSLGSGECWGHHAHEDSLLNFFFQLIDSQNLIDVDMEKLPPMWINHRIGEDAISQRNRSFNDQRIHLRMPYMIQEMGRPKWPI